MTVNASSSRFQSTLSVRRATAADGDWRDGDVISIHALRKESDQTERSGSVEILFQSTLSVRRATNADEPVWKLLVISIHALRKESDGASKSLHNILRHFNPRSP